MHLFFVPTMMHPPPVFADSIDVAVGGVLLLLLMHLVADPTVMQPPPVARGVELSGPGA